MKFRFQNVDHYSVTAKNPPKMKYEIIPKCQRLTEDTDLSEKLTMNRKKYVRSLHSGVIRVGT